MLILLLSSTGITFTQQEITADDVFYAAVDSIFPGNDTVKLTDMTDFPIQEGDKVMILQMTGADYFFEDTITRKQPKEYIQDYRKTGNYEITSVKSIDQASNLIVFIDALQDDMNNGEAIQVVKVVEHNIAVINSDINVKDWDGSTGGVFPIITYSKLTLNADINAGGTGFRGGNPSADPYYNRECNNEDTKYYHVDSVQKGGLKGEGFMYKSSEFLRGAGRAANGGGGGNGKFSGGGGGANYGTGGSGGKQASDCSQDITASGGKIELSVFYKLTANLITFGGGGGTSTHDATHNATKGGDGGGIVLILTDTLESNNGKIITNGQDVSGVATAGGGGGGAGGTVLLDYSVIKGDLTIDISGGMGGEVQKTDICTGAGGGGGGGIVWHNGETLPGSIMIDKEGGEPGVIQQDCLSNLAFEGKPGDAIGNLRLPLTGFLFNFITGTDTICAGQIPDTIKASMPRGGDGNFEYNWQYSLDSISWQDYPADEEDSIFFTTNPLDTTTYFRRVVTSAGEYDTSKYVKVFVWPAIENNNIRDDQTLCYLEKAETLTGDQPTGGDENFFYRWEKSENSTDWTGVDSANINQSYEPGIMDDTTYYRRYIQSVKICRDYSDTVKIIVQPDLENFDIGQNQNECFGYLPEMLNGTGQVTGGNHNTYYYFWEHKQEASPWNFTNNDTTTSGYQPPPLSDSTQFRRIVKSGVCIDTSNIITINIQPPIENNLIFEDHKICYAEESPVLTDNGLLSGGNHMDYINNWQVSHDTSSWNEPEDNTSTTFSPGPLFETSYFRRIIESGACFDTSNTVEIEVVPEIINSLSTSDTTLCNGFAPDPFDELPASGGYGNFTYEWQRKPVSDDQWNEAPNPSTLPAYEPVELSETMLYRREVTSDVCTVLSDSVRVTILPSITNNLIVEAPLTYTCYQTPKDLETNEPNGGNDGFYTYQWEKSASGEEWMQADAENASMDYRTPALSDSIYYRRLVFSGQYNQCKDTSSAVLVRIHDLPTGQITSSMDTAVCDGQPVQLELTLTGQSPWDVYLDDNFEAQLEHTNSKMLLQYQGTETKQEHVIAFDSLVDANNCKATDVTGSVTITSVEVPEPEILQADDICEGTAMLEAAPPKFMAHWSSEFTTFSDSTNPITEAYALRYDTAVTVAWTEINDICSSIAYDSLIFFRQPDEPGISEDTVLYYEFMLEIETNEVAFGNVTWKVLEEEDSNLQEQTETYVRVSFPNTYPQEYSLIYEVKNGECLQSDTMLVVVEDIFTPNAFSPNGDGINDYFYIEGIEDAGVTELIVFNSWGSVVYDNPNYDMSRENEANLWDGTDENGQPLPDGTYYYILNVNNERQLKGFIVLRRSASGR